MSVSAAQQPWCTTQLPCGCVAPVPCAQTQKVFGNKWNDIAAYLPMRCNNDIKNYFNLYLKDKSNVFSENCYLRSGYDLHQLLQAEPDEVMHRRQRLDAEKVRCT